jgi:hypothetical protein
MRWAFAGTRWPREPPRSLTARRSSVKVKVDRDGSVARGRLRARPGHARIARRARRGARQRRGEHAPPRLVLVAALSLRARLQRQHVGQLLQRASHQGHCGRHGLLRPEGRRLRAGGARRLLAGAAPRGRACRRRPAALPLRHQGAGRVRARAGAQARTVLRHRHGHVRHARARGRGPGAGLRRRRDPGVPEGEAGHRGLRVLGCQ